MKRAENVFALRGPVLTVTCSCIPLSRSNTNLVTIRLLNSSVSKHQKRSHLCSIRSEITIWKKKRYHGRRYCGRLIFITIPLIRLAVCVSSFVGIAAFHQATNNERDNDNAIIASVATTGLIKRRNDRRAKIAIQAGSRSFDAR